MDNKKLLWAKGTMALIYLAGAIGLAVPNVRVYFLYFTPVTLLLSTILLLYFHSDWNRNFVAFLLITYLTGFGIEAVGVATGIIFGEYSYTDVLGPQLADTPLMIGINWIILIYAVGTILATYNWPLVIKALAGAVLMLLLDFTMEPVAISLNFWKWSEDTVPLVNYIAWFTISFFLLLVFHNLSFRKYNRLALFFYVVQTTFFLILSIAI